MIDINLGKEPILLVTDKKKLDAAINIAVKEAKEALRSHYLPDLKAVPELDETIGGGTRNHTQVVYHLLDFDNKVNADQFIQNADMLLSVPSSKKVPKKLKKKLSLGYTIKYDRISDDKKFLSIAKNGFRLVMQSLLRQKAVLLPPNPRKYLPVVGFERQLFGVDILSERLRDICSLQYKGITASIDWTRCEYKHHYRMETVEGMDRVARLGRFQLISVAMCTTWDCMKDVTPEKILNLRKLVRFGCIGQYLTYLYLKRGDSSDFLSFFEMIRQIPWLKLYVREFKKWSDKKKKQNTYKKRNPKKSVNTKNSLFKKRLSFAIQSANSEGQIDGVTLAKKLQMIKNKLRYLNIRAWPQESVLPEEIEFDWLEMTSNWVNAIKFFLDYSNYEMATEKNFLNKLQPFIFYLTVYLPVYFQFNTNSDAAYPRRVDDLVGGYFISRPVTLPDKNLPLPYVEFLKAWHHGNNQYRRYDSIRALHQFFDEILKRKELLGIKAHYANPVMKADIPSSGGRPWKTDKVRMPSKVFWLGLLILYKMYEYIVDINKMLLEKPSRGYEYKCLWEDNKFEEIFDIRTIEKRFDLNLDKKIYFNKSPHELNLIPTVMLHPQEVDIKKKGSCFLIAHNAVVQILVAMETGLRHQTIQWLDCDFDKYIRTQKIDNEEIYRLHVNTDKSRKKAWISNVSGRVIKLLRDQRRFRQLLNGRVFKQKIFYEGDPNSKWGCFFPLFSINKKSGMPHTDTTYRRVWEKYLISLQFVLDFYDIDYSVYIVSEQDKGVDNAYKGSIAKDSEGKRITPHATRTIVVSEWCQILPHELVGRYITGQRPETVAYYNQNEADEMKKVRAAQKSHLQKINRDKSRLDLELDPVCIEAADKNAALVKGFETDAGQAIIDFGGSCSNFFPGENGIDVITNRRKIKFSYDWTHICPFNHICPEERKRKGYANRHNFCDYAIRTVDNLPAIECTYRDLEDELESLENFIKNSKSKLTDVKHKKAEAKRKEIAEDMVSLLLSRRTLLINLKTLRNESRKENSLHIFSPEAVLMELEAVPFPDRSEEEKHIISRIKELKTYMSLDNRASVAKMQRLCKNILANTGNMRDAFRVDSERDLLVAKTYGILKNLMTLNRMSLDDIVKIAQSDVTEHGGIEFRNLPRIVAPDGK